MFTYKSTNKFGAVAFWIDDFDRAKKELAEGNTVIYASATAAHNGYHGSDVWKPFTDKTNHDNPETIRRDRIKQNYHNKAYEGRQKGNLVKYQKYKSVRHALMDKAYTIKRLSEHCGVSWDVARDIKINHPKYDHYRQRFEKDMFE